MKSLLKNIRFILVLLGFTTVYCGCNKEPNIKIYTYPVPVPLGLTPNKGYSSTDVTITGSNFGTYVNAVSVFFGGVKADTVRSCMDSQIVVKVPLGAVTGKVTLKIWTHTVDSIGSYTVVPFPAITSITSNSSLGIGIAAPGDTVTFKGINFGTDVSKVVVSFNGTNATIIIPLADNSFKTVAPDGYASGSVTVTVNGYLLVGTPLLNPTAKGDISIFYLKNYQRPFVNIANTIAGSGSVIHWGVPANWTITAPCMNQINNDGTVYIGGLDFGPDTGGYLSLQGGWANAGSPQSNIITNGKLYQTITLPAGKYSFGINVRDYGFAVTPSVYLTIATGSTLPDFVNVPTTAFAYADFSAKAVTFTLTQSTQVSIGFVTTMVPNSYLRLNSVSLTSL